MPQPDTTTVTMDAVIQLMRDDRMRSFRVDIETDSTVEADENEYKQRLSEFLTGISVYLEKVLPVGQSHPELVPFLGDVLTTIVRGFRVGRQLEGTIEEAVQALGDKATQAQNAGPRQDPQQEAEIAKTKAQVQTAQIKAQAESARAQTEQQIASLDFEHAQASHQARMQDLMLQSQLAQQKHDLEMQKLSMGHQVELSRLKAQTDAAMMQSVLKPPVAPMPVPGGE